MNNEITCKSVVKNFLIEISKNNISFSNSILLSSIKMDLSILGKSYSYGTIERRFRELKQEMTAEGYVFEVVPKKSSETWWKIIK
jgi:hypothetical protein